MMSDAETRDLFNRTFDLVILDGAYPECAIAFPYKYGAPFMYINTVGFYMDTIAASGSPALYSITPGFFSKYTDDMNLYQRTINSLMNMLVATMRIVSMFPGLLKILNLTVSCKATWYNLSHNAQY